MQELETILLSLQLILSTLLLIAVFRFKKGN